MGLMDKLRGEFVDIIEWLEDSRTLLAWRFPRYQCALRSPGQSRRAIDPGAGRSP